MDKESINLLDELNINKTLENFNKMFKTLCNKKEKLTDRYEFYREEENFNITLIEATDKHCLDMYIGGKKTNNFLIKRINIYNIIKENKVDNPEDILDIIENKIQDTKIMLEKVYTLYNNRTEHSLSLPNSFIANNNMEVLKRAIATLSNDDKEQEFASYVSKITSIPNNNDLRYSISYKLYDDMPYLIRINIYEIDKKSYTETFDVLDFVIEKDCDVNKILEVLEERISYLVKNIFS